MLWGKKEQGPSGYQDYCRDFNNPTSHRHMLDLRWLGICLSLKMGGELIQQVSLHKGFPFILLKPPVPLLPETMLWTRWTAGGASTSLGISPLYLLYFCIPGLSFLRHLGTESTRLETAFQPALKYCEALPGRFWWPPSHPRSPWPCPGCLSHTAGTHGPSSQNQPHNSS